jgi:hypothetical protein
MPHDHEQEKLAWEALDDEDAGNLTRAVRAWKDLANLKDSADAKLKPWGLLGDKYLKEIEAVEKLHQDLRDRVDKEADAKKLLAAAADRHEAMALEALVADKEGKTGAALLAWDDLRKKTDGERELRRWYVLAVWRHRELTAAKK